MDRIVFCCLWALVFIVPWEENFTIAGFESFSRIFGRWPSWVGLPSSGPPCPRNRCTALIVLFFFAVWSFTSMIWSIDRAATLDRSISFMLLVVFSWLIYQFTDTPSRQQWLMRAYIFGTAIVLAAMFLGVVHFAESSGEGAHRFTAKGANPNGLAFAYITSINFALYLVTRPGQKVKGFMKAAYWVFIVLAGCGVFYTGSRSGALGLGICGFFSLVTMFRVVGWKPAAILVICIAVIGFLVVELVPGFLLCAWARGSRPPASKIGWRRGREGWPSGASGRCKDMGRRPMEATR